MIEFEELYASTWEWMCLGNVPVKVKPDFNMEALKDMVNMRGSEAPEWAIEALKEDDNAS